MLSGASTVIGAIIIFALREPILDIHLAFVAGLAAAVMCFVSFFDMLLPNLHLSSSASSSSIDPHTDMDNSITIDSTTNLHVISIYILGILCAAILIKSTPDAQVLSLALGHDDTLLLKAMNRNHSMRTQLDNTSSNSDDNIMNTKNSSNVNIKQLYVESVLHTSIYMHMSQQNM